MRHAQVLVILLVSLFLGESVHSQEQDADVKSAIAELNRFNGTWEKQFTLYKSEWTPAEQTKSGTQTNAWILDDRHLQETGRDSDGMSYMTVYSYDVAAKVYRASVFQSNGNSWQMSGKWDAQTGAFVWSHELGDGIRVTVTYKFVTADQFKFSHIAKSKQNKELLRIEGTGNRRDVKK